MKRAECCGTVQNEKRKLKPEKNIKSPELKNQKFSSTLQKMPYFRKSDLKRIEKKSLNFRKKTDETLLKTALNA